MEKPSATARNAVKHGIFVAAEGPAPLSPFAQLAKIVLSDGSGPEIIADLTRAEGQTIRCQAAILRHVQELEVGFANMQFVSDAGMRQLDEGLRKLNRLLRYQGDSLNKLRKHRIEVLNAAEGIDIQRRARGT